MNAGLAHGFGDVGVGHVASDEVGREVEDLARVAVVRRHVEALTLLRPEGLLACLGGFVEVGPRRLREVADDGPRRELSAPTDGAPLHRRQVLRLVDEDVTVFLGAREAPGEQALAGVGGRHLEADLAALTARSGHLDLVDAVLGEVVELLDLVETTLLAGGLGHLGEAGEQVVDERNVGHGPLAALDRDGDRRDEFRLLTNAQHTACIAREPVGVTEPQQHVTRVDRAPPVGDERLDVARILEAVDELGALQVRVLAHLQPRRGREGLDDVGGVAGELVVLVVAEQARADAAQLALIEVDGEARDHRAQARRRVGRDVLRGAREHLSDAQPTLDGGRGRRVEARRRQPADEVAERAQRHRILAERRQDALDVRGVGGRRADDEDAARLESAPIRVEQVGRAVQRDDGLARARPTRDEGDAARVGADRLVLVALDRRHDVAHPRPARARQGGHERAVTDDRHALRRLHRHEVVLDAEDASVTAAQHAAAHDLLRGDGRRAVER